MGEAFHQKTSSLEAENLKPMGRSRRKKINGTSKNDVLTGTKRNDLIRGHAGDDIIESGAGMDKVWGGNNNDRFVTTGFAKGHMKIMDMEVGEVIEYCGCPATTLKQKGKDVWITLGSDVKAVIKNTEVGFFEVDGDNKIITLQAETV